MKTDTNPSLHNPSSPLLALGAACGAGVLWGTGALVVNVLVIQHGFSPENISFRHFVIGSIVLVSVFGRKILWNRLQAQALTVLSAGTAMAGYVLLHAVCPQTNIVIKESSIP